MTIPTHSVMLYPDRGHWLSRLWERCSRLQSNGRNYWKLRHLH